ncbi:MAG: hypothetical protein C3F11_09765 [Methylocystaceae bacterium]|nr:MAG: hypothetical protein C3F11_09765 [Methylocystaceae bacterium]
MKNPSHLALSLLCLLPSLAIAQEAADRAKTNPMARLPLERFSETRQRPLFSATRRPPPLEPVAVRRDPEPPSQPEPPSLMLVGVLIGGQAPRALVRSGPADKVRNVEIGDDVGGWRVVEIAPRRVVLARDTRTSSIALFEAKNRPAKAPANAKPRRPD